MIITPDMTLAYLSHKNVTDDQKLAIAIMAEFYNNFKRFFPERMIPHKVPNTNIDIRKTFIFKCCLCAVHQIKGEIDNYRDWVIAQLAVLRAIKTDVIITGQCLCGESARKRYLVWLKHRNKNKHHETFKKEDGSLEIIEKIKETHNFLATKRKTFKQSLEDGTIKWLLEIKKINPYYVALHPDTQTYVSKNGENGLNLDGLTMTDIIKSEFQKLPS